MPFSARRTAWLAAALCAPMPAALAQSVSPGASTSPAAPAAPSAAPPATTPAAPASVSLNGPSMTAPLAMPSQPYNVNVGPLGKWYVDGVVTGMGLLQTDADANDHTGRADLDNGMIIVQKVDGIVQFYAQAGVYSFPTVGTAYTPITRNLGDTFSALPVAYLKIAPLDNFSIIAGKLPTLIGAEQVFTFENMNIERGLLWNQEPIVSKGVQANYTIGPVALSLSLNDGYYSNRFNWISASAAWTINPQNTLSFVAGGNVGTSGTSSFATPVAQNNSQIYNIIYTYNKTPLTITPYVQVTHVDAKPSIGLYKEVTSVGGAVLANYQFNDNFSLAGRLEYISTDGSHNDPLATNLLYGPGSNAFSATLTPTYQWNRYFVRLEGSWTEINDITSGDGFGGAGTEHLQIRGLIEGGVLF